MKKRRLTPDDDFVGSRLGREKAFLELSPNERLNHMFRERNRLTAWGYFDAKPPERKRIVFFHRSLIWLKNSGEKSNK